MAVILAGRNNVVSFDSDTYLGETLPSLIQASAVYEPAPERVIQFIVIDKESCEYVYRLGGEDVSVHRGLSDQVDLTLAFVSSDLEDFSKSQLDVAHAIRSGRLKVMGDESLLSWLADRLDPRRKR